MGDIVATPGAGVSQYRARRPDWGEKTSYHPNRELGAPARLGQTVGGVWEHRFDAPPEIRGPTAPGRDVTEGVWPVPRDGFNQRDIDKFTKDLNRRLQRSARRNIRPIPIPTSTGTGRPGRVNVSVPPPTQVVNGPLIHGDNYGPMAWDNVGLVYQTTGGAPSELTADDLAHLRELSHQLLTELAEAETVPATARIEEDPTSGPEGAEATAEAVAQTQADASAVWAETQQVEPDPARLATLVRRLKTALPALASGIVSSSLVEAFTSIPW